MFLTMLDVRLLIIAALMAALIIAIPWVFWSHLAASSRRMSRMMSRIGLNPGLAVQGDGMTRAVLADARRLCRKCPSEDLCERWLAKSEKGEAVGGNAFCPNAKSFRSLKHRRSLTLNELTGGDPTGHPA